MKYDKDLDDAMLAARKYEMRYAADAAAAKYRLAVEAEKFAARRAAVAKKLPAMKDCDAV